MVDPMSQYSGHLPNLEFYSKILPIVERFKTTTFPELVIMDSHLKVFKEYNIHEVRYAIHFLVCHILLHINLKRLINLEIPVLVRSLKSSNVELS